MSRLYMLKIKLVYMTSMSKLRVFNERLLEGKSGNEW